jgi:hypothetical protein
MNDGDQSVALAKLCDYLRKLCKRIHLHSRPLRTEHKYCNRYATETRDKLQRRHGLAFVLQRYSAELKCYSVEMRDIPESCVRSPAMGMLTEMQL